MMAELFAASGIIATRNRAAVFRRTLESLALQSIQPNEIIVVDASEGSDTRSLCAQVIPGLQTELCWIAALEPGAAVQRNQAIALASQPVIWFFDDDIVFKSDCVARLWAALQSDRQLGGVNAMIINQRYQPPGLVSRLLFLLMHGQREKSFAGKVVGPAINLLPEDRDDLPKVVPVEWLNTTCTMYRREALPSPPFDSFFSGYSLMEDVTLSLRVAERGWRLANVRNARIFHDSQPSEHKDEAASLAEMELVNRHYVMSEILHRTAVRDYLKLAVFEVFSVLSGLSSRGGARSFWATLRGKQRAVRKLFNASRAVRAQT